MKICYKCGKEIHDEAVICVHCGCAVEFATASNKIDVNEYNSLMTFVNEAKTIKIFGILSIVLCLGIGIIFQIINLVKIKKYKIKRSLAFAFPEFNLSDKNDIRLYEDAKRKIITAHSLTTLGFSITIAILALGICFGPLIAIM